MNRDAKSRNMMDTIVAQSGGKINRKSLDDAVKKKDFSALLSSLSVEDQKKLGAVMSDKAQLRELLKSEEAKAMLKSFLGGEKHG